MKLVKLYETRVGNLTLTPTISQWGKQFYLKMIIQDESSNEPTTFDVPLDWDLTPPFVVVLIGEDHMNVVLKEMGTEKLVLALGKEQLEKIRTVLAYLDRKEMITEEELNLLRLINNPL